jgi:hypothetical protein
VDEPASMPSSSVFGTGRLKRVELCLIEVSGCNRIGKVEFSMHGFAGSALTITGLDSGGLIAQDRKGQPILVSGLCAADFSLGLLQLGLA